MTRSFARDWLQEIAARAGAEAAADTTFSAPESFGAGSSDLANSDARGERPARIERAREQAGAESSARGLQGIERALQRSLDAPGGDRHERRRAFVQRAPGQGARAGNAAATAPGSIGGFRGLAALAAEAEREAVAREAPPAKSARDAHPAAKALLPDALESAASRPALLAAAMSDDDLATRIARILRAEAARLGLDLGGNE